MAQYVETPTATFEAGGALGKYLRAKLSAGVLAVAGVSDVEIGTTENAVFASGDEAVVRLRSAQGTAKMTAAGAITQGAEVFAAAAGKIDDVATAYSIGHALEAATADGDVIEVLRHAHTFGTTGISSAIADPGDAGAIPVTQNGYCPIVTAGAETRTIAAPTFAGQQILLQMHTDGGDAVIASAAGTTFNAAGNNRITFAEAADAVVLTAIDVGGTLTWRITANDGGALSTV